MSPIPRAALSTVPPTAKSTPSSAGYASSLERSMLVDPFAKVIVSSSPAGGVHVEAYLLTEQTIERAAMGLAIDGSASMMPFFARTGVTLVRQPTPDEWRDLTARKLARKQRGQPVLADHPDTLPTLIAMGVCQLELPDVAIVVEQVRSLGSYLAQSAGAGRATVLYWATGSDGEQIEMVGELSSEDCMEARVTGPSVYGAETRLAPAVQYFADRMVAAEAGLVVFVSDGVFSDFEAVRRLSTQIEHEMAAHKRAQLKCFLLVVGARANLGQLQQLEHLKTGPGPRLWDCRSAGDLREPVELLAEFARETQIVAQGEGVVKDSEGRIVQDYRDTGLPAQLVFELPPGSDRFILEIAGHTTVQPLVPGIEPISW